MKTFLKVIFGTLWGCVLLFFLCAFPAGCENRDPSMFVFGAVFSAIWLAITLGVYAIYCKRTDGYYFGVPMDKETRKRLRALKKQKKYESSKKYRDEFISVFELEHPYFGKCVFEKDSNHKTLKFIEGMDVPFGKNTRADFDMLISEDKLDFIMSALEKIYRDIDKTIEAFSGEICGGIREWCSEREEFPLTDEEIMASYDPGTISVSDDLIIIFAGFGDERIEDELGGHGYDIYVDPETLEYDLRFEG